MRKHPFFLVLFFVSAVVFLMQPTSALAQGSLFGTAVNYGVGDDPRSITIGDFDGDGDYDLAVANSQSDNISVLLGNGNGTFASAVNYSPGVRPMSVTSADFDGDGDIDLAVANWSSDNVSILLGNGNGTFASAVNYSVGDAPFFVTSSDFNGDGDIDLAAANGYDNNVSILLGNGNGTFASAVNYSVGTSPRFIYSSDFDGDGDNDLAVANGGSDKVTVRLGNGDGTFAPAVHYSAGMYCYSVTSSDFDGDGDSDLATANYDPDNVSVLLGNGDGTFASAVNYSLSANASPQSVTSRDLDGDGDSDLAVTNNFPDNVSILLGNGDGTFASADNYNVVDGPYGGTSSDFDGDGDYDLAVANGHVDNVSILLNLTDRPPLPIISSITDIPNDQGKQAAVTWNRCGPDWIGSSITITEYAIYRKIDFSLSSSFESYKEIPEELVQDEIKRSALLYPPGHWHYLTSVPACAELEYSVVLPTLADSTISEGMYYSTFFIRALTSTPAVYYDSAPDSGYSVDNLQPGVPLGFSVAYNTGSGNELSWEECEDEDLMYYNIYRSESGILRSQKSGFESGEGILVHPTTDIQWVDTVEDGWKYLYQITSVDYSGNESEPKEPDVVTGIDIPDAPSAFALYQNHPNPFNPLTTIRFDLPAGAEVNLSIYSAKGEKIRILLDRQMTAGRKTVDWNGRGDSGEAVASGVYFYRILAGNFKETRKMILLR